MNVVDGTVSFVTVLVKVEKLGLFVCLFSWRHNPLVVFSTAP